MVAGFAATGLSRGTPDAAATVSPAAHGLAHPVTRWVRAPAHERAHPRLCVRALIRSLERACARSHVRTHPRLTMCLRFRMVGRMHTLVFNSQKGGAGKTTASWNVAAAGAAAGYRVLMVDLDPQQSLRHWWDRREALEPQMLAEDPAVADLPSVVEAAAEQFDLLVIDTPPAAEDWVVDVMRCADRVIIPVRASGVDLDALGDTIALVERAGAQSRFLITQADVRSTIYRDTLFTLADLGRILPAPLARRTSHERDFVTGTSGLDSSGLARNDVRRLWQSITEDLYGKGTGKPRRIDKKAARLGG